MAVELHFNVKNFSPNVFIYFTVVSLEGNLKFLQWHLLLVVFKFCASPFCVSNVHKYCFYLNLSRMNVGVIPTAATWWEHCYRIKFNTAATRRERFHGSC